MSKQKVIYANYERAWNVYVDGALVEQERSQISAEDALTIKQLFPQPFADFGYYYRFGREAGNVLMTSSDQLDAHLVDCKGLHCWCLKIALEYLEILLPVHMDLIPSRIYALLRDRRSIVLQTIRESEAAKSAAVMVQCDAAGQQADFPAQTFEEWLEDNDALCYSVVSTQDATGIDDAYIDSYGVEHSWIRVPRENTFDADGNRAVAGYFSLEQSAQIVEPLLSPVPLSYTGGCVDSFTQDLGSGLQCNWRFDDAHGWDYNYSVQLGSAAEGMEIDWEFAKVMSDLAGGPVAYSVTDDILQDDDLEVEDSDDEEDEASCRPPPDVLTDAEFTAKYFPANTIFADSLLFPDVVHCSATPSQFAFSRVAESSLIYGWKLTQLSSRVANGRFALSLAAGGNIPIVQTGDSWYPLVEKVSQELLGFCERWSIPVVGEEQVKEHVWHEPVVAYEGPDDLVDMFERGSAFFPATVRGRAYGQMFVALAGDHSDRFGLGVPVSRLKVGEFEIIGCAKDTVTNIKLTRSYTLMPVDIVGDVVRLQPWLHCVNDSSWELAVSCLEQRGDAWPGIFTGCVSDTGVVTAGAIELKYTLAASTKWTFPGTAAPFIIGPGLQTNLRNIKDLNVPSFPMVFQLSAESVVQCDSSRPSSSLRIYEARLQDKGIVHVEASGRKRVTKVSGVSVVMPGRNRGRRGSQVVRVETAAPRQQQQRRQSLGSASLKPTMSSGLEQTRSSRVMNEERDQRSGGVMPYAAKPARVSLTKYLQCLTDPFFAETGCKIPDMVILKSTTFCTKQRLELTVATDGSFAIYAFPWFRGAVMTNNFNNANATYAWVSASTFDTPALASLLTEFTMARPVASAIKASYAGKVLDGSGVITGALLDPGSTVPVSYIGLTSAPENVEYQLAGDSAAVQVNWKPMTLHDQPYREVTSWPIAALGPVSAPVGKVAYYPTGPATNVAGFDKSVWVSVDANGNIYNQAPNGLAYMMIAGKGLVAGSVVTVDVIVHYEATIKTSSITVGKLAPTASVSDSAAMSQAAGVLAVLPAVRKPDENFGKKIIGFLNGVGEVAEAGFGVARRIKTGFKNLF